MVFKVNDDLSLVSVLVRNVNELCMGCYVVVDGVKFFVGGDMRVSVGGGNVFVYDGDRVVSVFSVEMISAVVV